MVLGLPARRARASLYALAHRPVGLHTYRSAIAFKGHRGPVHSAAFTPDGAQVMTASRDGRVGVWDAVTGREIATHGGKATSVIGAHLSSEGARLATLSDDGIVTVWDVNTGRELTALKGHQGWVSRRGTGRDRWPGRRTRVGGRDPARDRGAPRGVSRRHVRFPTSNGGPAVRSAP
jgi:WD40 repeat protein